MKLALAILAGLPLIAVNTRDTVNFAEILFHITGKKRKPKIWSPGTQAKIEAKSINFWICPKGFAQRLPLEGLYEACTNAESSLIIVNINQMEPILFDCGEVDIPKDMLHDMLFEIVEDESRAKAISRSLGGCTLKEGVELARLTMAETGGLTADGIMSVRKNFFQPSQGFTQVDTKQHYYQPSEELNDWIEDEGGYFLTGGDRRLRARGLIFAGFPGTGKTAASKFIAHKFGVPLFRLDIGATKNKYVGESEHNLLSALARLEAEEPAVLLMDEVEKIFGRGEYADAGTTTSMLSQILWWLQEHNSRVLCVMTTNNLKALPTELTRPGRIDRRITTSGLTLEDGKVFAKRLSATFDELKDPPSVLDIKGIVQRAFIENTIPDTNPRETTHADVTEQVHKFVKHKVTISQGLSDIFKVK